MWGAPLGVGDDVVVAVALALSVGVWVVVAVPMNTRKKVGYRWQVIIKLGFRAPKKAEAQEQKLETVNDGSRWWPEITFFQGSVQEDVPKALKE